MDIPDGVGAARRSFSGGRDNNDGRPVRGSDKRRPPVKVSVVVTLRVFWKEAGSHVDNRAMAREGLFLRALIWSHRRGMGLFLHFLLWWVWSALETATET